MKYQGAISRLLQDAAHIPLGNIGTSERDAERRAQEQAITDALNGGVSEKTIFLTLHNDKSGMPSMKVQQLLSIEQGRAAA